MAGLYDSSNVLITDRVTIVVPSYETYKVENRLLSGQYETQTIGTPARIVTINLVVLSEAAKDMIDVAEGIGEPLKVTVDSKYYIGTVRLAPIWEKLAYGIYRTNIVLLVSDEGVV